MSAASLPPLTATAFGSGDSGLQLESCYCSLLSTSLLLTQWLIGSWTEFLEQY